MIPTSPSGPSGMVPDSFIRGRRSVPGVLVLAAAVGAFMLTTAIARADDPVWNPDKPPPPDWHSQQETFDRYGVSFPDVSTVSRAQLEEYLKETRDPMLREFLVEALRQKDKESVFPESPEDPGISLCEKAYLESGSLPPTC